MADHSLAPVKSVNREAIVGAVSFSGDGAITTDGYGAAFSYARTSAGVWTVTLSQKFRELMSVTVSLAQTTPTALFVSTKFPVGGSDGKTIIVNVVNTSAVATDIATNDRINLIFVARNTADGVI